MQTDKEQRYSAIVKTLLKNPEVTRSKKKGFGSSALWTNGKIFVTLSSRGEFVVRLPKTRVDEFVNSGSGKRWDPRGDGRLMKEWLAMDVKDVDNWLPTAREAIKFVRAKR